MSEFKFKRGDVGIWIIFFCLCIISVVEVFSASSSMSYKSGDFTGPVLKHVSLLIVGIACMIGVSNIPCKYFKLFTPLVLIASVISLFAVLLFGESTNGASRWLPIFGIQFQPSELAKGATVLAIAQILSALQTPGGADKRALKYIIMIALPICFLIFLENFSTALLLAIVVLCMMVIGGVPWRQLLPWIGGAIAIVVLFLVLVFTLGNAEEPVKNEKLEMTESVVEKKETSKVSKVFHRFGTWKKRILKFTDGTKVKPEDFDLDEDGQVGHANIAIVNSDGVGVGPGNSVQRDFLSQAFSDFIFAIIIEELGIPGALFVCALYIFLLFRVAKIANRCENSFPAFLVMGLALMLSSQAMFNMMVAVGLGPVTGQPLPLISKGGTSTILNCIYIGMILSVSDTAKKNPDLVNA
ncbi:MAG: FtsW/RodA/SpoVE family cell cycle protein [Bacteroidaceae bacterium]|nr:FtsW/RodA/SpoVE family cell cycle protein [Bacteroidaceae bacterium]